MTCFRAPFSADTRYNLNVRLAATLLFASSTLIGHAQIVTSQANDPVMARYPDRIPDWLWQDPRYAGRIPKEAKEAIFAEIRQQDVIKAEIAGANDKPDVVARLQKEYDDLTSKISIELGHYFDANDLARGGISFQNRKWGLRLVLQLDPTFTKEAKKTITAAAKLYLELALDHDLIANAIKVSVDDPSPMPPMFRISPTGEVLRDPQGKPFLTTDYEFYLTHLRTPRSVAALQQQLKSALSGTAQMPALLLISSFTNRPWWGASYYDYFYEDDKQLTRQAAQTGMNYIRLNAEKMLPSIEHYDDVAFWAAKIGHEVLHGLSYWHPVYLGGPEERDANNKGNHRAFIVAYEQELDRIAHEWMTKHPDFGPHGRDLHMH